MICTDKDAGIMQYFHTIIKDIKQQGSTVELKVEVQYKDQ